ncbi:MAG: PorT family protein [Chitinispirillia bacterium]|nr:PorT family protein [Chitinispirillia bacterium]
MSRKAGFLLMVAALSLAAQAQTFKLTVAENGGALIGRLSSNHKEQIIGSAEVGIGDTLFTLTNADARISLESNSALLIKNSSVVVLTGEGSSISISLEEGQIFLDRNQPHELTSLRILAKGYIFTPTGTAAAVKTTRQGVPTVAVLRGTMQMRSPRGGLVSVEARQFGTVNSSGVLVSGSLNEKGIGQLEAWSGVKAQRDEDVKEQDTADLDSETLTAESDTANIEVVPALSEEDAEKIAAVKAPKGALRFGFRAGANLNTYAVEWSYIRGMGYGGEAGVLIKHPFTNRLSISTEVNICYRILGRSSDSHYSYTIIDGNVISIGKDFKESIDEMALLIPLMVQFTPNKNSPFYVSVGVQAGIPFKHEYDYSYTISTYDDGKLIDRKRMKSHDYVRSKADAGVVLGIGSMLTPNLGFDLRLAANVNDFYDHDAKKVFDGWQGRAALMNFTFAIRYFL